MRRLYIPLALIATCSQAVSADDFYDDDIYYNPSKEKKVTVSKAYIADFAEIDPDDYNRRGQYYATPADTIGNHISNEPDFVYTQQIQKYYNPTIIINNAGVLAEVLDNSYGNVEIIIDNGYPAFAPAYSYSYSPWAYNYYSPWGWDWAFSVGPIYSGILWGWGNPCGWLPSWNLGFCWNWPCGGGPSWSWNYPVAHRYSNGGNRRTGPRPGWSGNANRQQSWKGNASHRRGESITTPRFGNDNINAGNRLIGGHRRNSSNSTVTPNRNSYDHHNTNPINSDRQSANPSNRRNNSYQGSSNINSSSGSFGNHRSSGGSRSSSGGRSSGGGRRR